MSLLRENNRLIRWEHFPDALESSFREICQRLCEGGLHGVYSTDLGIVTVKQATGGCIICWGEAAERREFLLVHHPGEGDTQGSLDILVRSSGKKPKLKKVLLELKRQML